MIMRVGTCAQNLTAPSYDKIHILLIDLDTSLYVRCIDDSVDVWCGDAMWEPNEGNVYDDLEACDDGNNVSGDGCKGDCSATEPYWTCVNTYLQKTVCNYVTCGNGIFDAINP